MDEENENEMWKEWSNSSSDIRNFPGAEEKDEEKLRVMSDEEGEKGAEDEGDDDEFTKGYDGSDGEPEDEEEEIDRSAYKELKDDNVGEEEEEDDIDEEELDEEGRKILEEIKRKQSGSSDEEEDEEEGYEDAQEESRKYKQAENNSIDLSDLDERPEDGGEKVMNENSGSDIPSYARAPERTASEPKTDFNTLNGIKGRRSDFKPGKLNKNYIILAIGFLALITLVFFGIQKKLQQRKEALKKTDETVMNRNSYEPDYGDYASRRHKETPEEKARKDSAYVNDILTSGKKKPFEETKKENNVVYGNSTPVSEYYGVQGPVPHEVDSSLKTARDSPLRYSGNGFGRRNVEEKGMFGNILSAEEGGNSPGGGIMQNGIMDKNQFAADYLSRIGLGGNGKTGGAEGYDGVNNGRYSNAGFYDRDKEGGDIKGIPENSIYPGTVLPAVLVNGINTDFPGTITARITSPVYDSQYGQTLLIPQGSILRGSYSSASIGVAKVQIAWESLIINRNGTDYVVNLGSMVGIDKKGYSGIKGTLNDHYFQYVRAAGLSALFTLINYNIYTYSNSTGSKVTQEMMNSAQGVGQSLTQEILNRALAIQPTVVVKPGTRVNVDVDKVLTLLPVERDPVRARYERR